MSQLTLSNTVLSVNAPFAPNATSTARTIPTEIRTAVSLHPAWIERMGWSTDEPVLACRMIVRKKEDTNTIPSGDITFSCYLCRLTATDPTGSGAWGEVDLSAVNEGTLALSFSIAEPSWQAAQRTYFTSLEVEQQEAEERRVREMEQQAAALALAQQQQSLTSPSKLKTPVKSKPTMQLLPSASSMQAASPSPAKPSSAISTIASSIRLVAKILPAVAATLDRNCELEREICLMSLRGRASNATASTASTIPKCSRLVLCPLDASNSSDVRLSSAEEVELAGMIKRFLHRTYVCADATIDVRALSSPVLKKWKYLRVKEITPLNDVCQVGRNTMVVVDSSPSNGSSSAATSTSVSLARSLHASSATASQPVHPALAALHSLLLPPLLYPQAFEHLCIDTPKGLLLSGPPGVGKSYSVGLVCKQLDVQLFVLEAANVFGGSESSGVAGTAEEVLRERFHEARRCKKASVLFIDEIDVLCPQRTSDATQSQLMNRIVAQLLALMDGLENRGHLLIVGATNHPNSLDSALRRPGRFDRELRLDPPAPAQRLELLKGMCASMPVEGGMDGPLLKHIADRTIGYVAADLAALVREAALEGLKDWRNSTKIASSDDTATSSLQQPQQHLPPTISLLHFLHALTLVPASSLRGNGAQAQKPTDSFDSLGGLQEVKLKLQQAVAWPLLHAETFKTLGLSPPRGILLHGPPGGGKTSLVRAVAAMSHAAFLQMDTASLYSCYVGEAERILRGLFSRARANRPCVLFLDELDAMVHKREMGSGSGSSSGGADAHSLEARILSTLLNEMDGMESAKGLLIVAATNRLDMIDEALLRPGRFDQILYVPPPDAASRLAILQLHTRKMLATPDSPETIAELTELANKLEFFTGADIANLCREAALEVLRKNFDQEKVLVSDIARTAASSTPSLTHEMVRHYEAGRMKG